MAKEYEEEFQAWLEYNHLTAASKSVKKMLFENFVKQNRKVEKEEMKAKLEAAGAKVKLA